MNTVLIQFGAFNPIHLGHINNIWRAREYFNNKHLPAYISPVSNEYIEKHKHDKTSNQRLEMIKLALKPEYEIKLLDYELDKGIVSTITTLKYYYEMFIKKDKKIVIVMGDDNIPLLKDWVEYENIFKYASIIIIPRKYIMKMVHIKNTKEYIELDSYIDTNKPLISSNISSSSIKQDIDNNKNYLDKDVYDYIIKNNLFK